MNPVSVFFRSTLLRMLPALALGTAALSFAPQPVRAQTVDIFDVFVLYIEFEDEGDANNEPTTTGRGTFGSATGADHNYALDTNSPSFRRSAYYLTKRFEYVQNYFDQVSG